LSFFYVMEYLAGIVMFGLMYWLMNGILLDMTGVSITGTTYDFIMLMWKGILLVYLIFGGIWVIRRYNEQETGGEQF